MDVTEVTNDEYKKFVDATRHQPPPNWRNGTFPEGTARLPVTGVDWDDATAFAAWAGKRLPTEPEWEFAARGTDGRTYPWGNDWAPGKANAENSHTGMQEVKTTTGVSPFGLYDMIGNAWEWTSTDAAAYQGGKDFGGKADNAKIIRGGYWGSKREIATATGRRAYGANGESEGYANSGFRCVKDIPK
jgi:serine/threonine-protein kinase